MRKTLRIPLLLSLTVLLLASSCVSRKKIAYFQGLEEVQMMQEQNNISIKPDDVLSIRVSAPEQQATLPFNLTKTQNVNGTTRGGEEDLETYLVADDGTIKFPIVGKIKAEGLTNQELAAVLEEELQNFVQDPLVNVRILNFEISVLGEVKSPGTFSIDDDHISLPKALGLAGDVLLTGKRENVLVMRVQDGKTIHAFLDLTKSETISSPFYFLQQNDIVYVEPIGPKIQSASYLGTAASYLSIASVLVSIVVLITR